MIPTRLSLILLVVPALACHSAPADDAPGTENPSSSTGPPSSTEAGSTAPDPDDDGTADGGATASTGSSETTQGSTSTSTGSSGSSSSGMESDTGDDSSDGTGSTELEPLCDNLYVAFGACGTQTGHPEEGCELAMGDHPATGAVDACQIALRDRYDCYAEQPCDVLDSCNLWGCQIEDPCPVEAAAVESACERTACEQYWDSSVACGDLSDPTLPAYCEHLKLLDLLVAADADACEASYDDRIACRAALTCDALLDCGLFGACEVDGIAYCEAEEIQYEEDC